MLFRYNAEEITELDLVGKKQENPFLDLETHRFILDYTEKNSTSDELVYAWKLRDTYPCELYEVSERGKLTYKVWVTHNGSRHYLKLHKLPVDMFYMAYYLDGALMLHIEEEK